MFKSFLISVLLVLFMFVPVFADVTGTVYYDDATGHKYIKINGHYTEFTKDGQLFKIVPASLPLLNDSTRVVPINNNQYFRYVKRTEGVEEYITLPVNTPHPEGWKLDGLN